jgi:hypothetical protein
MNPRRPLAILIAFLAGCVAVPAAGAVTLGNLRARGSAFDSASVTACTTGASDTQRSATFSAVINAVPKTSTMSVSFDLYEQTSTSGGYVAVMAPGFGVWQTSSRGIASFTANENVVDLPAPASFRALVHFRWLNRRGRVIRRDDRVTTACVETVPAPDLSIVRIDHGPGSPPRTSEIYTIVIRNSGPGAAGAFEVALNVNGTALADQQVTGLAPQTATSVQFSGPRCVAGSTITAQVDPAGAITEPADANRTVSIPCPTVAGGSASSAGGATGQTGT